MSRGVSLDPVFRIVPIPFTIRSSDGFSKKYSGGMVSITRLRRPDFLVVVLMSTDSSISIIRWSRASCWVRTITMVDLKMNI